MATVLCMKKNQEMYLSHKPRCLGLILLLIPWGFGFAQRPDALVEYRNGNYEQAVSICMNEIAVNPYNLDAHVVLCWSLIRLSRYEDALPYALVGRNLSRYDPRVIEILGEISYYEGRNREALQYFQEYINFAPEGNQQEGVPPGNSGTA